MCDCDETWVDVKGYEGRYKVSSKGRVFTIEHQIRFEVNCSKRGKFMSKRTVPSGYRSPEICDGYHRIGLPVSNDGLTILNRAGQVHRLVAIHFIPNPDNKSDVNHLNGVKSHNCSNCNLEWSTRSENIKHAYAIGLQNNNVERYRKIQASHSANIAAGIWPKGKLIICKNNGVVYKSRTEASRQLGISLQQIYSSLERNGNPPAIERRAIDKRYDFMRLE